MPVQEVEYLRAGSVLVTSARVEINGQTFATRNIGSVKVTTSGRPVAAVILAIIGVCMVPVGGAATVMGIALAGGAIVAALQRIRTRTLVLVSGGGEVSALASTDAALVERTRTAVVDAIAAR